MTVDEAYVMGLASASVKLRRARDAGEGVTLDAAEVKALTDGLTAIAETRGRDSADAE